MPRKGATPKLTKGQRRRRRITESRIATAGGKQRTVKTVMEKPNPKAQF